jgi:hypothetical protein
MNWKLIAILGWGALFVACSTALTYPYYGIGLDDPCLEQGTLLGVNGKGEFDSKLDEPMTECSDYSCLIMKLHDHERLETDLETCEVALDACEEE